MMVNMRRYLLVLDTDLLALDEELDLEPINYLVGQQEQGPCEVVVLSLVDTAQAKQRRREFMLWAGASSIFPAPAPRPAPAASRPGHDASAAAEHRMNLTVRHLETIGCQASGLISDEDLVTAVDTETRSHHYDEVILTIGSQEGSWLGRTLHRDPIHYLQHRWGKKLTVFTTGPGSSPDH